VALSGIEQPDPLEMVTRLNPPPLRRVEARPIRCEAFRQRARPSIKQATPEQPEQIAGGRGKARLAGGLMEG
jgi:hypothetical protein